MTTVFGAFERVPEIFHTDTRTKESLRTLITLIGRLGMPSDAKTNTGYAGYWSSVMVSAKGKWRSERSQQYRENECSDMWFATPERHTRGLIISGRFTALGEVAEFPADAPIPRVKARMRAKLIDLSEGDTTHYCPTVDADFEISTAPASSEQAGGVGISADIEIYHPGSKRPFTISDSVMEVWDEMRLDLSNLPDYPEAGPVANTYFDGRIEHLQALTRLALGQWPA